MKKNINILIIGGGAVVQEYYLAAFRYLNLLNAITIIEPDIKNAAYLQKHKINVVNSTFQDFFENNKVHFDYAIITIPNYLHADAIATCLKHNIITLCEKPLCLDSETFGQISQTNNQHTAKAFIAMVRRLMPSYLALKDSLSLIGKIQRIKIEDGNPYAWLADSADIFSKKNGGVLADMGVHYIDLLIHLLNETLHPISYLDDYQGGVEANCEYNINSLTGIDINLKLSRTDTLKNKFTVYGEDGKLWIEKNDFEFAYFQPKNQWLVHQIKKEDVFINKDLAYTFEACFVQQIQNLLAKNEYLIPIEQAKNTTELIEWAYTQHKPATKDLSTENTYYITGGTGFIGSELIKRLAKNKLNQIKTPVRGYKNCASISRFDLEKPRLDLLNYEAVKNSLKDQKYVVHLAYSTDGKDAYPININATQNVVKAACEQGAEAIVILSTMNVYGFPNGEVNEANAYHPAGGNYGKTKALMQKWVLDYAKTQYKTRIVILNPTCVYGPLGKTYTRLPLDLAKDNRFCLIDNGQGLANIVYIENLLDAIELALTIKSAHAQNFIINDGTLKWADFLKPLLLEFGEKIPSLTTEHLLHGVFKTKTSLKEIGRYLLTDYNLVELINNNPSLGGLKRLLFKSAPKFRGKLDQQRELVWSTEKSIKLIENNEEKFNPPVWLNELFANTSSIFSAQKAKDLLNWQPKISIEKGLKLTEEWLKTH